MSLRYLIGFIHVRLDRSLSEIQSWPWYVLYPLSSSHRFISHPVPFVFLDNIAPAIASCLGDLVTLCLIGLVSTLLIPFLHTPLPFVICIIVVISASISLAYTLRNKHVRSLLGEGWTPLFGAMVISSGTGVVLDMFVSKYEGFPLLAVVISGTSASVSLTLEPAEFDFQVSLALQAPSLSLAFQQPSTLLYFPSPCYNLIINQVAASSCLRSS